MVGLLCCKRLASTLSKRESLFNVEDGKVFLSHNVGGRRSNVFLVFCPFCGTDFSKADFGSRLVPELSEEMSARVNSLFDGVLTKADVVARMGIPSREILRINEVKIEMHYYDLVEGMELVVLVRESGSLDFLCSPKRM